MKMWVIGRGYPTKNNRMWGSFELEQAKLLARNGYDVTYISLTLSFFSRKDPRGLRVFDENNVHVIACSHLYFPGKFNFYWESFEDSCWRNLFETASNKFGFPDIIHVHYPSMISSINVVEEYRKQGAKLFVTEHWSRVLINNLNKHELARLVYYASHANCFACVGESLCESVKELTNVTVPMAIIPNIVSPVFSDIEEKENHPFTFICVGRLVPLKQFDIVVSQFIDSFEPGDNVRLVIIGSGSEKKKLEELAKSDKRIIFTGALTLADVAKQIADSNVLVSYSKYETFAAPVAEAWTCGKPVIVSNTSGISSYMTNDLGIVAECDKPVELGKAMKYMINKQYKKEQIREFALNNFSDESIMDKLKKMYSEGE